MKQIQAKKDCQNEEPIIEEVEAIELSLDETVKIEIKEIKQNQLEFEMQLKRQSKEIDKWYLEEMEKIRKEKEKFINEMQLQLEEDL